MKHLNKIVLGMVVGALVLGACSTKKDAFINRSWHAMNTKYNTLYNGNIAFEEGRTSLNQGYSDNYWEILPVERLEITEELKLLSEDQDPNFVIAEYKATKAIQKHGMEIGGEERNPQIDEAFLLLGKARYFDQRFVPALEAFNYVLRKYPKSDKLDETSIWREKTNIRLENEELALKNLKRISGYGSLSEQEYADAQAAMAQAYMNLEVLDTAIVKLRIAAAYTKKPEQRGRYHYIVGQLYNQLGAKDSANNAFDRVIALKRKSPRVYFINAHLQKVANAEVTDENREFLTEYLMELEEDRENRPYLDKVYRQIALFYMQDGRDGMALEYYNKSLRANQGDRELFVRNYQDLAEYHFDQSLYETAGAYYDSTLINLDTLNKRYRIFKKRRDNLEDVIVHEATVKYTDSVLELMNMAPDKRVAYFEDHIQELKAKMEAEAVEVEQRSQAGFATFAASSGGKQNQGKFYFYNISSLGYGKNTFRNRWGDRALEDNWRWANKAVMTAGPAALAAQDSVVEQQGLGDEKLQVDYYLAQIPDDPMVRDSLETERNLANYQLGVIYKEKFDENLLATTKLETVLASNPQERLILPAKYNLYKIYQEENSPLAQQMKLDIIENYPNSRYAAILLNPESLIRGDADTPEARYNDLYQLFREQKYVEVITKTATYSQTYEGDPIVPKLEMLKAKALGRLEGFDAYKEALNYLALNFPNSTEGRVAAKMVLEDLPRMESTTFTSINGVTGTENWKVAFPFSFDKQQEAKAFQSRLNGVLVELRYRGNKTSIDRYNLETGFVVVHGFQSRDHALGFVELLANNKKYRIRKENFVILSSNYQIVQIHKNLEDYKEQILTPKS